MGQNSAFAEEVPTCEVARADTSFFFRSHTYSLKLNGKLISTSNSSGIVEVPQCFTVNKTEGPIGMLLGPTKPCYLAEVIDGAVTHYLNSKAVAAQFESGICATYAKELIERANKVENQNGAQFAND